ncbi:hypothetical protein C2G38_2069647 [Gigaspora rosea]|uniref:Uncharacterized protein n=1 Tax=Gigaspora rosea TaxID=44941 RepID=A0A397VTA4_9GLOM|nr:hypothetical protein C2G38_2069647 [Gigaspora rosea]
MIRPRRRDVNSRDINYKIFGGDGIYNEADGVICSAGFWLIHKHAQELYITTAG